MEERNVNEIIEDCEMLLVGIGSGFGGTPVEAKSLDYESGKKAYQDILNDTMQRQVCLYNQLYSKISYKNYFVIDTNIDGSIEQSDFNQRRVVAPCGSLMRVQCGCAAENGIRFAADIYEKGETCCSVCGQSYLPNVHGVENYNENGYIKQWHYYNQWLSVTLNKKLVILEIGSDFLYSALLRWPFEKITILNQKSVLIRVNENFPQGIPEIKDRFVPITAGVEEFVKSILL